MIHSIHIHGTAVDFLMKLSFYFSFTFIYSTLMSYFYTYRIIFYFWSYRGNKIEACVSVRFSGLMLIQVCRALVILPSGIKLKPLKVLISKTCRAKGWRHDCEPANSPKLVGRGPMHNTATFLPAPSFLKPHEMCEWIEMIFIVIRLATGDYLCNKWTSAKLSGVFNNISSSQAIGWHWRFISGSCEGLISYLHI